MKSFSLRVMKTGVMRSNSMSRGKNNALGGKKMIHEVTMIFRRCNFENLISLRKIRLSRARANITTNFFFSPNVKKNMHHEFFDDDESRIWIKNSKYLPRTLLRAPVIINPRESGKIKGEGVETWYFFIRYG